MIAEVTNHLWQSTVLAAVAALMTVAFRKNGARVRYGLWMSASLKFLLPFWLLLSLGNRLDWVPAAGARPATSTITLSMAQMSEPFPGTLPRTSSTQSAYDWTATAILSVWACGFAAVVLMRFRGWRRVRAAVRGSSLIETRGTMPVRSSPGLLEPGVVGLFRPVLLLPEGIAERLTPHQLEAVVAHELCHVRRRDNFTAALHMVVEGVFWFHPLVWWIGARLLEERERACDEEVLRLGTERRDYAEGILNVCKSYVESPLSCVSGVTGSNLKKRIHAILTGGAVRDLTFAKKFVLAAAGIAAISLPVLVGMLSAPRVQAQAAVPGDTPKFATASIKPCTAFRGNTPASWSSGTLRSQCTTVQRLIEQAYGFFAAGHMNPGSSLTVTGPAWTTSALYEIDAKPSSPQSHSMMNGPMLQLLLEDRFQLKLHRETREIPVYVLAAAPGGPKLQPFTGSCTPRDFDKPPSEADCGVSRGAGNGFRLEAATTADLCAGLSVFLNRPVIDETNITGRFNMRLDLSSADYRLRNAARSLPAVSDPTKPAPPALPLSAVKIAMKELGLDIDAGKGQGEFLVIDHIEKPSGD